MTIVTGRDVARQGIEACVTEVLVAVGTDTERMYASVDIDCVA